MPDSPDFEPLARAIAVSQKLNGKSRRRSDELKLPIAQILKRSVAFPFKQS